MLIAIDPGHGGSDPGAVGPAGTKEKEHTLAISLYLRNLLAQAGHGVVLTRDTDCDVAAPDATAGEELQARVDIANQAGADMFISVHINAAVNPAAQGGETWYYQTGRELARCLQAQISRLGLRDRGIKQANFYVLRQTDMPAVLVELGFITNPAEEALISSDPFRLQAAAAIADGIEAWQKGD